MVKTALIGLYAYLMTAVPALAHHKVGHNGGPPVVRKPTQVPEIDASAGLLALAAVATILLLSWERGRRRSSQP